MAPAGHCWSHPLAHHSLLPKLRKQRKQAFAGRNLCPPGEKAPHYSFQIGGSKPQKLKFHVRNWLRCIFRSTHLDQQSLHRETHSSQHLSQQIRLGTSEPESIQFHHILKGECRWAQRAGISTSELKSINFSRQQRKKISLSGEAWKETDTLLRCTNCERNTCITVRCV